MQSNQAILLFVRDERREAASKPLPGPHRAGGYRLLNRRLAERLRTPVCRGIDLVVVAETGPTTIPAEHHLVQRGGTFAERITHAIADTLELGYQSVVVVGNDCPTITPGDLLAAFESLADGARYVAAPAVDGGAFLVGASASGFRPEEFRQLPWCTASLFDAICRLAGAAILPIVRRDYDSWMERAALRALDLLIDCGADRHPVQSLPRPLRSALRRKALTRIYLPAPPVR